MSDDDSCRNQGEEKLVDDGDDALLLDRVFRAFSDRRRRYVLYYLHDHGQAHVDDIAAQIVAWESDASESEAPTEATKRIKTELVHSHLPELTSSGLLEYDHRSGDVSYTAPSSVLKHVVEFAASLETPP